jgi:uncharacterized protein
VRRHEHRYCSGTDERLEWVVADVTDRPWQERYQYVLPVADARLERGRHCWQTDERFHVSPFMPMDIDYEWLLEAPGGSLDVRIRNRRGGEDVFDPTLALRRRPPLSSRNLAATLAGFPLLTATIVAMIQWQALKLWLKGTPFHPHPGRG